MNTSQEDYFRREGGDAYFERNRVGQDVPRRDHPGLQFLMRHVGDSLPDVGRACVLGGAAGREAAALAEVLPDSIVANVDISENAIEFGRATFPDIQHHCLSITNTDPRLSVAIGPQDVVFAVAILHWIDRSHLSRAVANIDETVVDGGYLLIHDFLPNTNRKSTFKHAPEHHTFKQDYSSPFLSLGTYELIAVETQVADEPAHISEQERRTASFLLRKDLHGLYPLGWSGD